MKVGEKEELAVLGVLSLTEGKPSGRVWNEIPSAAVILFGRVSGVLDYLVERGFARNNGDALYTLTAAGADRLAELRAALHHHGGRWSSSH